MHLTVNFKTVAPSREAATLENKRCQYLKQSEDRQYFKQTKVGGLRCSLNLQEFCRAHLYSNDDQQSASFDFRNILADLNSLFGFTR